MKIRMGFVSNSSSSSFIIDAERYSLEKVKDIIQKLLVVHEEVNGEKLEIDSVCSIHEFENCDEYCAWLKDLYGQFDCCEEVKINEIRGAIGNGKCIQVDSADDNSIPCEIHEMLQHISVTWERI